MSHLVSSWNQSGKIGSYFYINLIFTPVFVLLTAFLFGFFAFFGNILSKKMNALKGLLNETGVFFRRVDYTFINSMGITLLIEPLKYKNTLKIANFWPTSGTNFFEV